ncbi:MAG: sigma-54-dependent Fis family transcriptional regulator [Candidatus Thermoplasmatota archaeon]|nr:sigma-54-dependent Fis family transcriptional regulator [Candidatus Thermoplasmatota archaeon]
MKELEIGLEKQKSFDGLVAQSKLMQDIFWKINLAAENDITVLISGESGTGKELVAKSIHHRSQRSGGPFIPINMGAVTRDLAPSELFGHVKGAFTGATELRDGLFENASGGTLFLDEVSTLDNKTQTSLLRILENREFRRVGGKKTIYTDARIIAATNKDLRKAVEEGTFRKDLYFRLEVFTITLPPLRERWIDIPLLIKEFIKRFNKDMGKHVKKVSKDAIDYLIKYEWPGNVRELKNVIQRAMLLSKKNIITAEFLPDRMITDHSQNKNLEIEIGLPLREVEKRYIERTLWWSRGNRVKAASMLGITRRTLYNKIDEYNL